MVVVEWIYPQKILRITSKYLATKEVEQRITGSSRGVLEEKIARMMRYFKYVAKALLAFIVENIFP